MLIGVGVSCLFSYSIVSYLYVSFSPLITSVPKKELFFLLSFTCNYVVSVQGVCLLLLVLGIGCVV